MNAQVATLASNAIQPFIGLKKAEDTHTKPDAPLVLEQIKRIYEHIKNLDAHFLRTLGMAKTPLGYIVWEDATVVLTIQNPPGSYPTIQEEMVTRMPHTHITFCEDNVKVWEIIHDSLHETDACHWIKRSQRQHNGRSAYLALTTHYLGASKNETLCNHANSCLLNTFYGGKKIKFDWTKYVAMHKKCHNDLEATGPPLGQDDRVQQLLNGINTQRLNTAVLFLCSSPLLMSNFDATVDSITTMVKNIKESLKRPFSQSLA